MHFKIYCSGCILGKFDPGLGRLQWKLCIFCDLNEKQLKVKVKP